MLSGKQETLREFQKIPGVGKSISQDLWNIGLRSIDGLKDGDPDALYEQMCDYQGVRIDRCMLYVLRCAVYYASHEQHETDLLQWWNWSDKNLRKVATVHEIT